MRRPPAEEKTSTDRAAGVSPPAARQGDDAGARPPASASSPDFLSADSRRPPEWFAKAYAEIIPLPAPLCPIGERPVGSPMFQAIAWSGSLTLLSGPGITLVLDAGSVDGIHAALGRIKAARDAERVGA